MPCNSVSKLALDICDATGATPRQLDYWARHGVFGDEFVALGSGTRRPWWKPNITEAVDACVRLASLGAHNNVLCLAAATVTTHPVADGEWLVVTDDGAVRHDHVCFDEHAPRIAAYMIPLRSFAATSTPTGDSDLLPAGNPAAGSEDGRHRSAPVSANHAITT